MIVLQENALYLALASRRGLIQELWTAVNSGDEKQIAQLTQELQKANAEIALAKELSNV